MDDTIYRQAALDALYHVDEYNWLSVKAIRNLPSAQPEIIHCESCKHWKNEHICECLSRYGTFETPKNFYCGYGKAK